ncbi:hypothetical protein J5N97_021053 [Dioscorea zingiberensis]|uniref:Uncharacterized protein n=1 Tax=Dioscorea zingiberensis TaxID=325984 RepID=A0A9D5CHQ6_9LILI|nr:hypothetical protein J5N97_021053 [Dioscorea zingiberensis]
MARFGSKHYSGKYFVVLACILLLCVALIADFLWASSSSPSYFNWSNSLENSDYKPEDKLNPEQNIL